MNGAVFDNSSSTNVHRAPDLQEEQLVEKEITNCEMISRSFGCRKALCHTGCTREGQITRDRVNSDWVDE